jgi:hypothetical protein
VKHGDRVRFVYQDAGLPSDRLHVLSHLVLGTVYILNRAESHGTRTDVWLRGHADVAFNAAHFVSVRTVDPRLRNRRRMAKLRARWKQKGQPWPARARWLEKQKVLYAERRSLGLCPDCGEPTGRYVRCTMDRARMAKNNRAWWLKKKSAAVAA